MRPQRRMASSEKTGTVTVLGYRGVRGVIAPAPFEET
jgi:hypothetical protein